MQIISQAIQAKQQAREYTPGSDQAKRNAMLVEKTKEFSGIFVNQMIKSMRQAIPDNGLLQKNNSMRFFEDMLYEEYAKNIASADSFPLTDTLLKAFYARG